MGKPINIEPTEEQKQAAKKATEKVLGNAERCKPAYRVAQLLATREYKLRDDMERLHRAVVDTICAEQDAQAWNLGGISVLATSRTLQDYDQTMAKPALNEVAALLKDYDTLRAEVARLEALCTEEARLIVERDTLRARVAELEANDSDLRQAVAELEAVADEVSDMRAQLDIADTREAQHLADIKALRSYLSDARYAVEALLPNGDLTVDDREVFADDIQLAEGIADLLADTAHYDEETKVDDVVALSK